MSVIDIFLLVIHQVETIIPQRHGSLCPFVGIKVTIIMSGCTLDALLKLIQKPDYQIVDVILSYNLYVFYLFITDVFAPNLSRPASGIKKSPSPAN